MKKTLLLTIALMFVASLISNCAAGQITYGFPKDRPKWAENTINEFYQSRYFRCGAGTNQDFWFIYVNPEEPRDDHLLFYFEGTELAKQFVLAYRKSETVKELKRYELGDKIFIIAVIK